LNYGVLARRAVVGMPLLMLVGAMAGACGARSGLQIPPPAPPKPECTIDSDCPGIEDLCNPVACRGDGELDGGTPSEDNPGKCVLLTKVDCDDHDPCTNDTCDGATGKCHYVHATLDLDGDGYFAPLPGHRPGDPGSCGDDCDDTNANAHPGGIEVCDGVDNDCNGIIDDNMTYTTSGAPDVRLSQEGDQPAGPAGLAWNGQNYFAMYTGVRGGTFHAFDQLLNPDGSSVPPGETSFVTDSPTTFGGPLVWVGDRFGTVWEDNRNGEGGGGYEIYFAGIQPDGMKVAPGDIRVTFAGGFSTSPSILWNGNEFLLAWQDSRNGSFDVYAQRVALDGSLVGDNVALTNSQASGVSAESPSIATGVKTIGAAWFFGTSDNGAVQFQPFSLDLTTPVGAPTTLSDGLGNAVEPVVVWNRDRYVVTWYEKGNTPHAIYGATVDETGKVLLKATAMTTPGNTAHTRFQSLKPLGDRLLFVYASDRDDNDGFELYSQMILPDLTPVTPATRLTDAPGDSISPIAVFGPKGDVAIEFQDSRLGGQDTWFTRLVCNVMTNP
jgi:hypothetical protein